MLYKFPYAIRAGRIVHIGEVRSGLKCGCLCPACGQKLVAKKGRKNVHHFAHYSNKDCAYGLETMLHHLAKSILENSSSLMIPPAFLPRQQRALFDARAYKYQEVRLEEGTGGFVPDLILGRGKGQLLVEIKVSHPVDRAKLWRIRRQGMAALEVDARAMSGALFGKTGEFREDRFRKFLLEDTAFKKWLHHPKLQSAAYRLRQESVKKPIVYRRFEQFHLYAVQACPLRKRFWKSGPLRGKPYARLWQDCLHCPYCLEIAFEKAFVGYREVPEKPEFVYCWGHLL